MNLIDELSRRVVLGDGAMGSRLFEKGVAAGACFDALNLDDPALVASMHGEYLDAGAECIETNTFGANAFKLAAHGLADQTREINLQGARIAREKAGDNAWVLGSIGPVGRLDEAPSPEDLAAAYAEQAAALAEGGVDALILETFADLDMLLAALGAAKNATDLPVIAQMVFPGQAAALSAGRIASSLAALRTAGADVVGLNCGIGPLGALSILRGITAPDCPLSAFPNAGYPERAGDRLLYNSSPDYFARATLELADHGASPIGGCCGTGPEHIAALRKLLDARSSRPASSKPSAAPLPTPDAPSELAPSRFHRTLGKRKMLLVELDPPKHMDPSQALTAAHALTEAGVDAITVAENPLASPRLSNTVLAGMISRATGTDVIVHMTGRDRNLVGMQSTIMGLAAQGLNNVLAITGDPPPQGTDDMVKGVFDLRSFELIALLSRFNEGENHHGAPMRIRPNFAIGGAFNPNTKNKALQVRRAERKIASGARYFLTQPVYTVEAARETAALTKTLGVPVFLGVMPLVSTRNAEFLHNEFPGISIPQDIRDRMREAGDEGARVGADIAWELIREVWNDFSGIYLIPPFNRYAIATDIAKRLKQRGMWKPNQP